MQCAPKLVYPSQDRPVRMAVSQWLTSVQDYPWASAWLISPDHTRVSALQPVKTHISFPTERKWKFLSSPLVTSNHSPKLIRHDFQSGVIYSQPFLTEDSGPCSLTYSLERLDSCCPTTTWLSGVSKDLPTYGMNHLTISGWWLVVYSFMKNKHRGQFSNQTCIIV